jgi:hypothetical protein
MCVVQGRSIDVAFSSSAGRPPDAGLSYIPLVHSAGLAEKEGMGNEAGGVTAPYGTG